MSWQIYAVNNNSLLALVWAGVVSAGDSEPAPNLIMDLVPTKDDNGIFGIFG
jgi:hypothetical protein